MPSTVSSSTATAPWSSPERVFETVTLPDGAILIPGVVRHFSDFIEHPELVAERLVRYAKLVGRGGRGARPATKELWGRA
jgi:5-methyltetrahydropteroyltriglutamate--homocysteine methyltransferase